MSRHKLVGGPLLGALLLLVASSPAEAQIWPFCDPCCAPACPPVVCQPAYRTVPVTEYRQYRQVVHKPVYETKYVDQKVTTYRPVTEARTVNVPTVRYENVTQYRTVYRNCGYWQTRYQCVNKPTPCQYDPRPNLFGWLNRTAYSLRAPLMPNVIARRQYVRRVVAQQVPYTRTIAHRGTRKVTYNVTRMVAHTTTRKVAVNTVRYVAQNITRTQPVTVWRTVPIGTTIAYGSVTPARTALSPTPDPAGARSRTANSNDSKFNERSSDSKKIDSTKKPDATKLDGFGIRRRVAPTPATSGKTQLAAKFTPAGRLPSAVRARGWISRRQRLREERISKMSGPQLLARRNR